MKGDSAPRLSWQKGKVEKLIYGDDNLVRGADVCVYQDKLGKTIVIRRPLQLLVPLEVMNIIHNDCNGSRTHNHSVRKRTIWSVWPNG